MKRYVSEVDRKAVAERAQYRCEYCRVAEEDHFLAFQIDHIISLKHGGTNDIENLAYCCPHCNQYKGTDLSTRVGSLEGLVPLFDPRKQDWQDHFSTEYGEICGETPAGIGTVKLLRMNDPDQIILRGALSDAGRYP